MAQKPPPAVARFLATTPGESPPTGTQALQRGVRLLRELATRPRVGWGLSELALRCELDKATTYRIVSALVRERLAARHPHSTRYVPGPLLFELGLSIDAHDSLRDVGREIVVRMAGRLGGICALTLASGHDAVCAAHAGVVATKALSFSVGDRRPLVMNSAGVAMLLQLPDAVARVAIAYGLKRAQHLGDYRMRMIRSMIDRSTRLGFGLNQNNTVSGITGVAVAIVDSQGHPVAALSISGTSVQFPADAVPGLAATLRREAKELNAVAKAPRD